jgi:O-methyltransferase
MAESKGFKQRALKTIAAPLRDKGRLESLLRFTKMTSANGATHQTALPHATYAPWWGDAAFQAVYAEIKANTYVDVYRLYELWRTLEQVQHLEGDILEVGVWRGGSGCLLGARARDLGLDSTVYLCDTFAGVANAGDRDLSYTGGEHDDTSMAIVRALADRLALTNVELLEGIFPEETGDRLADRRFRMCHIDVDVYDSAKAVLEWVLPRLADGGAVVFDDYGFYECNGVTEFVDEVTKDPKLFLVHNLNGHAVVVKLP